MLKCDVGNHPKTKHVVVVNHILEFTKVVSLVRGKGHKHYVVLVVKRLRLFFILFIYFVYLLTCTCLGNTAASQFTDVSMFYAHLPILSQQNLVIVPKLEKPFPLSSAYKGFSCAFVLCWSLHKSNNWLKHCRL